MPEGTRFAANTPVKPTTLKSADLSSEHEAPDNAPSVEIPVTLAGKQHNLRFVGTHWFDLKTVFENS